MVRARSAAVGTGVGKAATRSTPPKGGSRRQSTGRPARRCQRNLRRRWQAEGRTQSRKRRADERTRTADLISLRVIGHVLQGLARGCNHRIYKPVSLLRFARSCTVLRSRWYQSGIRTSNSYSLTVGQMARPRDLRSHNPPIPVSRSCSALQNRFR